MMIPNIGLGELLIIGCVCAGFLAALGGVIFFVVRKKPDTQ